MVVLCAMAAATAVAQTKAADRNWTPPKTAWGDPDLQGVWTSDDSIGVPFERPRRYGNRKLLTEEEYAERAQENHNISTSVQAGVNPHAGYWVQHEGVDAEPYSSNWTEYARQTSRQTSLIVDPEDGHFPPLTQEAIYLRSASIAASRKKKPAGIMGRPEHVRPLHHPRRPGLHAPGDLRKRDGYPPGARACRDSQ